MKASNTTDKIELMELTKLINRHKVADVRRYNMKRIEQDAKSGRSSKAAKANLFIGKNRMHALRDKEINVITNIDRIVEVAEELYSELHRNRNNQDYIERSNNSPEESENLPVTTGELRKALEKNAKRQNGW